MPKGKKKGFADPEKMTSEELTKLWDQIHTMPHEQDSEWLAALAKRLGYKPFYERTR